MAEWYSYHQTSDGRFLSLGTVRPSSVRAGVTETLLGSYPRNQRPTDGQMWDEATASFVARTPRTPDVDRLDDIMQDARLAAAIGRMSVSDKAAVRAVVAEVLGDARYRRPYEDVIL